jgi:hypothetical protein
MWSGLRLAAVITIVATSASSRAAIPEDRAALGVAAVIETTLKTDPSGGIRQFAFDGDRDTFFRSAETPGSSDHFTLVFNTPVALKSVEVMTGKPNDSEALSAGALEVSADGETYEPLARFRDGRAVVQTAGQYVQAVRIRPEGSTDRPLVVREIVLDSEPKVVCFNFPVEFSVDVSEAPDMRDWAEMTARECERQYPMINEALKTDGYKPAQRIALKLDPGYEGVAYANGTRIVGSVKFFKAHPDDVGAMIHETCHVVQRYRGRGENRNPGWLVEGVADHVRFFRYEPENLGPINARRARYNASYRVTAAFLEYVARKYDADLVLKLNQAMRDGNYREDIFKELTGKTVQELDEEWRATLK